MPVFSSEISSPFLEPVVIFDHSSLFYGASRFISFSVPVAASPRSVVERKDFNVESPSFLNGRLLHALIHHDTHRFKQLKEMDVLTRRAKDPSITSVFECSHANKTGCPCKFVLREDQTGEIIGEHTQDTMHINDIYSWRLFEAKQLILDDLINDPFIARHKLDKVFNSPDFIVDQFTPSKASLRNAIARLKAKVFGSMKVDATSLSDWLKSVTTLSGERFTLLDETRVDDRQSIKELLC